MTDYTKSTNFATKDSLPAGSALKIVRGTELDVEFTNIATAVATKADLASPALTGNPTAPTPTAGDNDTSIATTAFVTTAVGAVSGFKNRIINGSFAIDQRNSGSSQTITAGAALAYTVDRWYAYSTGANVTGQRIAGAYTSSQYRYQFTGASSVTAIGFGHRIEASNSFDLANTTATLSCYIANSLLTTVTWTAYYASTTDSFGTLASPTRTQIATGTFTVTSTRTQYSTNISIPSAATTGIEIVFTVGAQTSGTWVVDSVQLEKGSTATSFDYRPYGTELALCQRYYATVTDVYFRTYQVVGAAAGFTAFLPVKMRASPTLTKVGTWGVGNVGQPSVGSSSSDSTQSFYIAAQWAASADGYFVTGGTSQYITASAEL